jgi:hypothetical protein
MGELFFFIRESVKADDVEIQKTVSIVPRNFFFFSLVFLFTIAPIHSLAHASAVLWRLSKREPEKRAGTD